MTAEMSDGRSPIPASFEGDPRAGHRSDDDKSDSHGDREDRPNVLQQAGGNVQHYGDDKDGERQAEDLTEKRA